MMDIQVAMGIHQLTSGRLLVKNTVWNLLGQGVPVIAKVVATSTM